MIKILTEDGGTLVYNGDAVKSDIPVVTSRTSVALPQTFTAMARKMPLLVRYGLCSQASTPSPSSHVDIMSNCGVLGIDMVDSKEEEHENGEPMPPVYVWESLRIRGKNYATDEWVQGTTSASTGNDSSSDYRVRQYVRVKPSTQYTVSVETDTNSQYLWLFQYKTDGTYLGSSYSSGAWQSVPLTFTTHANAGYVTVLLCKNTGSSSTKIKPDDVLWIQVEEGTLATEFEGYAQKAQVPLLLSADTVKDEVDVINGIVTHRLGIYVFTGREISWVYDGNAFRINLVSAKAKGALLCSHFEVVGATAYTKLTMPDGSVKADSSTDAYVYFRHDASGGIPGNFCAWLEEQYIGGTPVVLVYQLTSATTEPIDYAHLNTYEGSNTVDTDSKVSANADMSYITG